MLYKKSLIIILVIILIIIAGVIIWQYDFTSENNVKLPAEQNGSRHSQEPTKIKQDGSTQEYGASKKIPKEFFSYIGEITEISNNQIMLNAFANNNNLLEDKVLTINLTEQTIFTKISIPKILTGDKEKDKIQKIEIKKSDIIIGQKVLVQADESVANKTEFTASKVEVQEVE